MTIVYLNEKGEGKRGESNPQQQRRRKKGGKKKRSPIPMVIYSCEKREKRPPDLSVRHGESEKKEKKKGDQSWPLVNYCTAKKGKGGGKRDPPAYPNRGVGKEGKEGREKAKIFFHLSAQKEWAEG